jgi:hypothetical protein
MNGNRFSGQNHSSKSEQNRSSQNPEKTSQEDNWKKQPHQTSWLNQEAENSK